MSYEMLIPDIRVSNSDGATELVRFKHSGRLLVLFYNQGGYDCVDVDLAELIDWYQSTYDSIKTEVQSLILKDKKSANPVKE
jgi:hypothetical protein